MNKQINEIIPLAIATLNDEDNGLLSCYKDENKNEKMGIDKKVNGYITSLGTALLQSGVFSSIAFFDKKQEEDLKPNLSKAIAKVMKEYFDRYYEGERVIDLLIKEYDGDRDLNRFKKDLIDVSIAFKLATRTFYLIEE